MGPLTTAVFDDTCGNLIQIASTVGDARSRDHNPRPATDKLLTPAPASGDRGHLKPAAGLSVMGRMIGTADAQLHGTNPSDRFCARRAALRCHSVAATVVSLFWSVIRCSHRIDDRSFR